MAPENGPEQIGKLALDRGLVTFEQLSEAIREQERRRSAGGQLPIGEILIDLGFLARAQLEALLESQGKAGEQRQPIAGFELIKKLGEGGMGATYLARQHSMDRMVALKVLRREHSRNRDFVKRFVREARLAGRLSHVNIVHTQDVGESGGFHYLVMEYVEGRSAWSEIASGRPMPEERALHVSIQMARALDYAHQRNIVHRDIKPDNILLTADGVAKLCDFGLARDVEQDTRLTRTGVTMGTPHYISPEQARGSHDVDIRSDIYSLGATLYHLVTGKTPFDGPSSAVIMTKHLTAQVPWPRDVNTTISENCCRLVTRMMAKEAGDRYQTPAVLLRDMELVIDGKPPQAAVLDPELSSVAGSGTLPTVPAGGKPPAQPPAEVPPPPPPVRKPRRHERVEIPMPPIMRRKRTDTPRGPAAPVVKEGLPALLVLTVGGVLFLAACAAVFHFLARQGGPSAASPGAETRVIRPVIDLARPTGVQLRLYPGDRVRVIGFGGGRPKSVNFGTGWQPVAQGREYVVAGDAGKPVTPGIRGTGWVRLRVVITADLKERRELKAKP